ncbi:DUF2249 domain-containing protein [Nonomuraea pusilla]|uniref:DUF2249 domain-containing protein n=1 Tax=Nonomuraea pusilla TaxID=46177 RepID=UPI0033181589
MPTQSGATLAAIRDHHDRLTRTMDDHVLTLRTAFDRLLSPVGRQSALVDFCVREVLPHAEAEERTLYAAADELPETRLLAGAMRAEHATLRGLVEDLRAARTGSELVAAACGLNALFQAHVVKENEYLLPALAEAGVDLAALLSGMHDLLGEGEGAGAGDPGRREADAHACACGGHDAPSASEPVLEEEAAGGELDVRRLAHGQRHERIFATFAALPRGTAFVLVNDHDPMPLRYQFAERHAGEFSWDYVESGPRVWRVRIGRP